MIDVETYGAAVGAAKRYTDEHSGGSSDAVKYTEQTLTSAQQAQARENIGAAAVSDIPSVIDYSTAEQDTGIKWVDGKPIFQKTYAFDPPISGGNTYIDLVDVSGLSIDTLIYMSGIEHDSVYGNFATIETHTSDTENLFLTADKSTVRYISRLAIDFLTLRYTRAIIITKQPEDVTVAVGENIEMSIVADGNNLSYQWQYKRNMGDSWTNFGSSTTPSATTPNFSKTMREDLDGLIMHCRVTDINGRVVYSDVVTVTLAPSDGRKYIPDDEKQGESIDDESKTFKNINGTFTWVDDM